MKAYLICLLLPALCFSDCIWLKKANFDSTCISPDIVTGGCEQCASGYTPMSDGCYSPCTQGQNGCNCVTETATQGTIVDSEIIHGHLFLYLLAAIGVLAIIGGAAYLVKTFFSKNHVKTQVQQPTFEISSKYVNLVASN